MMKNDRHANLYRLSLVAVGLSVCMGFQAPSASAQEAGNAAALSKPAYRQVQLGEEAQDNAQLTKVIAQAGQLSRSIPALASIMADDTRIIHLRPAGAGKVTNIHLVVGARVRRNDVLLEYRNSSLRVANVELLQAEAGLASAQAQEAEAASSYQRAKQLAGGALSRGEENRRYALLQQAKSTLAMREADMMNASNRIKEFNTTTERGDQLQTSTLVAPVDGLILSVNTSMDGDLTQGQDVATIIDLSSVWIVSEILPKDAAFITVGARQWTSLPGHPEQKIESTVEMIDGVVNPATGLIRIRSHIPNADYSLRPGMMLNSHTQSTTMVDGIIIPSEAVQRIDGVDVVFVPVGADSFQLRPIKIGLESDGSTVVLEGLKEGEPIVTRGSFTLKSVLTLADAAGGD